MKNYERDVHHAPGCIQRAEDYMLDRREACLEIQEIYMHFMKEQGF
jgi:hypothetical protein